MVLKQFEEWWNNQRGGALENFELDKHNHSLAWQAALEWQKAECIKMDESHITHCDVYCSCYNNVLDIIEEELGNEEDSINTG